MNPSNRSRSYALACLTAWASIVAGCGGGGSGDDSGQPGPPPLDPAACLALPDEVSWFRGSASNDWNDVLIDDRGHVWLAGYAGAQIDGNTDGPAGNSRAVLRRLAPDGRLLYEAGAAFDTPGTDSAEALALGADGSLVVAGRSTASLAGGANRGGFDGFVAWTQHTDATSDGAAVWRFFQSGNERPQHPRRVRVAADGAIVVAGQDDLYITDGYLAAYEDPFVLRLTRHDAGSPNDRLQPAWLHQFQTVSAELGHGLALGPGGVSYVAGQGLTGAARGMFVRKLDAQGQAVWTRAYSTVASDSIESITVAADGQLLVAASIAGPGLPPGGPAIGLSRVLIARLAAHDGRVLASWEFASGDYDRVADLQLDPAGNLIVFGDTTGGFVPGQPSAGGSDLFLLKVSPRGQLLARRQWGTADDESARRVAVDRCGRVLAVAASTGRGQRAGLQWFWRP